MNDSATRRSHEIINLKILSDINSEKEDFYWNTNIYQSAIKQNEKLLSHIAKKLEQLLNYNHKKSIFYSVDSKLDAKERILGLCVHMHYRDDSDMNINLLINESESLALNILKSIKFISETSNIDINNVKIEEKNKQSNNKEDGVILVEKGLKNTIYDILDDLKSNNEVKCEIGEETIEMSLLKKNIETFESDDVESIIGRITGVHISDNVAYVISENKKEEKYSYSEDLETELALHLAYKRVLKISLRKTYRNFRGGKKHAGGIIIKVEEYTKNQQLDLSDL